ncbi:hypothetical protein LZD57_12375 [Jiella sp. CBK1P-4]|uniref:Uncharacterized protein n=2 Tax=Jiella avicenniae TaxID=2907202 RepID=A0A9X1P3T5_9HYPH|nr:hypothetical protein [Jiella avicenniae]MCE7028788.1 hypothetical protein [Jiella avicenniae]
MKADWIEAISGKPAAPGSLVVGRDLAATRGMVVFRNRLI